ncbi:uncharacterized protein TNCV_1442821 [Trichonephila clavipes]|nr:uncharacterized protein TNCV_1442821 [Trichonephila clavipes]
MDLRFGQKYSKDYARLQMKTRLQKTGESLQEYASEIEKLANLAFSDYPTTVREIISLQYFMDGLKNGEIMRNAATQASRRDRHSIRGARVTADAPCESPWIKEIKELRKEIRDLIAQRQKPRRRIITC